jgi:hypothetical protein
MFLIILYFFIIFVYFYYLAPVKDTSKNSLNIRGSSDSLNVNKINKIKEKFEEPLLDLHYIRGLPITIPEPAYKADTNFDDRLINDVPSLIRKSKGKNISEIFGDVTYDSYNLFGAKNIVMPSSYTNNYVNVPKISNNFMTSNYTMDKNDPGIDTYTTAPIFATWLPKIN